MTRELRSVAVMLVVMAGACSSSHSRVEPPATSSSTTLARVPRSTDVSLSKAGTSMRVECTAAARSVGFAVPCPSRVPTRHGQPLDCAPLPIPTPYPLCVGLTHDFFIEWTNFDVPTDFAGIDGKPAAHVIINATPARDVPAVPCLDAIGLSTIALNGTTAIEYRCPRDSPRIERLARHGEGAYAGHVTLTWTHDAIRYLVSSHGYGTASKHLAEDLARALSFVQS